MKNLLSFVEKYEYILLDTLTYNSYGVRGMRDSYREGDSISVSEILNLLQDQNMEFVKKFYKEEVKAACVFGSKTHKELELADNGGELDKNNNLHIQKRLCVFKEGITVTDTEKFFSLKLEGLPEITGTIDILGIRKGNKGLFDYKTSSKKRNFKTLKHKLQLIFYEFLSGIEQSGIIYLNDKGYSFVEITNEEREYLGKIVKDLIIYTKYLFENNRIINLNTKG